MDGGYAGADTVIYTVSKSCGSADTSYTFIVIDRGLATNTIEPNNTEIYPSPGTTSIIIMNANTGSDLRLLDMTSDGIQRHNSLN